jgi:hypothetical protein
MYFSKMLIALFRGFKIFQTLPTDISSASTSNFQAANLTLNSLSTFWTLLNTKPLQLILHRLSPLPTSVPSVRLIAFQTVIFPTLFTVNLIFYFSPIKHLTTVRSQTLDILFWMSFYELQDLNIKHLL